MKRPPFDMVVVVQEGQSRRMTSAEFLNLELPVRVRIIMERSVQFYADGELLDRSKVLRDLRAQR